METKATDHGSKTGIVPILVGYPDLRVILGRSIGSLYRDRALGRLPQPVALGGSTKWIRDEIMAWIEAGCPCQKDWEAMKKLA